jgi:TolA-binding protein
MRKVMTVALFATAGMWTVPVAAQSAIEPRVDKLEREMRAVQRKVFPGGAGQTLEPQITAPPIETAVPGVPAGGALTDLTARVSALEASVRSVTGEVEQANFRVRQLEEAFNAYKTATDARLKTLESAGAAPAALPGQVAASGDTAAAPPPATRPTRPVRSEVDADLPAAGGDDRSAQVAAVERPSTGDAAEDGYTYGYRLWEAKLYPEAQAALKTVADKYPKHRRASYAQNLLGRAYLDEGKPSLASLAFYDSYKKFPDGARAPDSLYYLAQSLVRLKKPAADVCKVYGELTDVYGAKLSATMKADIAKGRAAQKCG